MIIPRGLSIIDPMVISLGFRKQFSGEILSNKLAEAFSEVKDKRMQGKVKISMTDALMSAFGMFSLKNQTLLSFDSFRSNENHLKNLKNLFGIEAVPSDTQMRVILDEVDPEQLRPAFKDVFASLQRGKVLEQFVFLDNAYLLSIDGTGYFSSEKVHCECCLERHSKATGKITYLHQMLGAVLVHPDIKQVIPFCPEAIIKQDGSDKNDCERNACKRFLAAFRKDHPRLKIIVTEDGLSSNAPHIKDLISYDMSFILGAKPGDHKHLFEQYDLSGNLCSELIVKDTDGTIHSFSFVNGLELNESNPDVIVNFLHYEQSLPTGKTTTFSWVTDIHLTKDNVFTVMQGGRARWKIENETFNTLKNQGYEFEHNFGHGKKNLSTVFAYLMMLAFLVDQVQLLTSSIVQEGVVAKKQLKKFYQTLREYFFLLAFDNWEHLYTALAYGVNVSFTVRNPGQNSS